MARRLIALILFVASTAATAEAVVGVVRDRAVHHQHAVTAAAHATSGQTDVPPSPDERPENRHDHDTGSDHCTHVHGVALIPSPSLPVPGRESTIDFADPPSRWTVPSDVISEPPRA
jgi:hypothetical protein